MCSGGSGQQGFNEPPDRRLWIRGHKHFNEETKTLHSDWKPLISSQMLIGFPALWICVLVDLREDRMRPSSTQDGYHQAGSRVEVESILDIKASFGNPNTRGGKEKKIENL